MSFQLLWVMNKSFTVD